MITGRFYGRALVAAMAFSLACSDSTAPNIELTEDQVNDMMDAFSAIGSTPDAASASNASNMAALIINQTVTVDCPNGGTMTDAGIINANEQTNVITFSSTQTFTACKATSTSGRLWTFDSNPNLTSTFTMTSNEETGAFSMTGSQTGGLRVASDLGSGACEFDVSYTMNITPVPGTEGEFTVTGSVSGTVCGRSIEVDLSVTE